MIIYVVKPGDSIYKISRQYGVPADEIIAANGLTDAGSLVIGQAIVIPGDFFNYTVSRGQSMYSIAQSFGIPLQTLIRANPGINPNQLQPGQVIIIPLPPEQGREIYVNGFVFPNVAAGVLQNTLPYLTYLSIFSYQVRENGSLKGIDDADPIRISRAAGTAPLMVITNIEEGSGFSSELAHEILTNPQTQDALIGNILGVLQGNNYYGLVIDFEYLFPEDKENYVNFVRKVVNRLRPMGYKAMVALAPKTSADQKGLLYEAHDYPAIGALADNVILMTYEWGYLRGPAEAVAPINKVRQVLDYAVSEIPSEKILMGMPNYGYDWTLPFIKGSVARILTNYGAVELAKKVGARIQFDNTAQAPFFNYYDSDRRRHEVWFDDARSYYARLRLVDEYKLGGVSYWTTNNYFAPNWRVLNSMYKVRKVL
ncbi:MAG: LysM peptidoglycan-binding domain-containing protein [Oscillospiraceae bacterium]|nr:LysM peptidoglycan-binding domain-containing protein [Oscillospiraceae bacterium]